MSSKKALLAIAIYMLCVSACSDPEPGSQVDPGATSPTMTSPDMGADLKESDLGADGEMGGDEDMSTSHSDVEYKLTVELLEDNSPLSLSSPALAAHPITGELFLYGGYDKDREENVGGAWRWENKQWRAIDVTLPTESGHGVVYMPEHERFGIFGNNPDSGWLLWDGGGEVSELRTPCNNGCPLGHVGHAMTYHEASQRVFMFGGIGSTSSSSGGAFLRGNTWTLQGTQWSGISSQKTPPARSFAAAAYDPVREVVWMFGGRSEDRYPMDDLWKFDGETWTEVQPFEVGSLLEPIAGKPPGRLGATLTWHPGIQRVVLLGGRRFNYRFGCCEPWEQYGAWSWDGQRWERLELDTDEDTTYLAWSGFHAAAYDPALDAIVAVGNDEFFARRTRIFRIEVVE